jgi:hypothetical protein
MRPGFHGRSKWKRSVQCAWKFQALAGGVGREQDAQRVLGRVGVEPALDLLAPCTAGEAVDHHDAIDGAIGALDGLLQDLLEEALRALAVLGEDQDAAVGPLRRCPGR